MQEVKITRNYPIAPEVYILEFERNFSFLPGQVLSLEIEGNAPRIYSIASGNQEEHVNILYDVKQYGKVTPQLKNIRPGDRILVSGPYGNFLCKEGPGYLISNGTGIAPFYSMFRSGITREKILIHGGRTSHSFYFQEELLLHFGPRYIRCSSRDKSEGIYHGRLTTYLQEQKHLPADQMYYLCGSAEMVVEVRDILISRQIPFGNIVAEIYF